MTKYRGWSDGTVGSVLTLHVANSDLMYCIPYDVLNPNISVLCAQCGVCPEQLVCGSKKQKPCEIDKEKETEIEREKQREGEREYICVLDRVRQCQLNHFHVWLNRQRQWPVLMGLEVIFQPCCVLWVMEIHLFKYFLI